MSKKVLQSEAIQPDPTRPFTIIMIDGKNYKMCFDYAALAIAEDALLAKGYDPKILVGMLRRTFSSTRSLFAASLHAYHPELDPNVTENWVREDNILEILTALKDAWARNVTGGEGAEKGKDRPLEPAE